MLWKFSKLLTVSDISAVTVLVCLSFMMFLRTGDSTERADTCGTQYFLPMFYDCNLFLEVSPCFNEEQTILVTMTTVTGERIYNFSVTFGSMKEFSLQEINKAKYEGMMVTSTGAISLYLHKTVGDSMIVIPIDAWSQDYETPSLTSQSATNESASNITFYNGVLVIFSPYNNATISMTPVIDSTGISSFHQTYSTLANSSSSKLIKLNAFDIHKQYIDVYRRYRLHSTSIFATILVQTTELFASTDVLCLNANMSLMDFVPPISTRGKNFFITFPNVTDFELFILGQENTSIDVITDFSKTELALGQSGTNTTAIANTSASWILASHPVTIYMKLTLCSLSPSKTRQTCSTSGFFLPSVEHYLTCKPTISNETCTCTCPSVFQQGFEEELSSFLRNTTEVIPLLLPPKDLFNVTYSFIHHQFKDATDVIINTNTSFIIFRYSLEASKFLPGGNTLGAIHNLCPSNRNKVLFLCHETESVNITSQLENYTEPSENFISGINQCSCEFLQGTVKSNDNVIVINPLSSDESKLRQNGGEPEYYWVEDVEDSARPLIAVVVSLFVSIFAVIALISGYMLVEIMTRRKHVRNTKIRPFVS